MANYYYIEKREDGPAAVCCLIILGLMIYGYAAGDPNWNDGSSALAGLLALYIIVWVCYRIRSNNRLSLINTAASNSSVTVEVKSSTTTSQANQPPMPPMMYAQPVVYTQPMVYGQPTMYAPTMPPPPMMNYQNTMQPPPMMNHQSTMQPPPPYQ
jgi:hypothetical protein